MGRKNRYETHVQPYLEQITEWYQLLNEKQIAQRLGISTASFEKYKTEYPELVEALKNGRDKLVEDLKNTLKKKAQGFYFEETKTYIKDENGKETKIVEKYKRYAQPDTGAIHLLLKNLDETWRNDDKTTVDLKQAKIDLEKQKAEDNNW